GFGFTTPPTLTIVDTGATVGKATLTFTANPGEGDTVTIRSRTYTFSATVNAPNKVLIGADSGATAANLIATINAGAGAGTAYGTGTLVNADVAATLGTGAGVTAVVTSKLAALVVNTYAITATGAALSWGGATLSGGLGGSGVTVTAVLGHAANPVVAEM